MVFLNNDKLCCPRCHSEQLITLKYGKQPQNEITFDCNNCARTYTIIDKTLGDNK